ncbi:HET-domain-containing protein [Zopfia rhizophila CBS 207.26]|uniref:HET-domain-containing protein n=1 Tax=Zopfia rhizophila CBS 207.26 TaxID=1314779 RepID=A0A6A6EQM2_9PEZI|nr:HET-domain-containing protein [Zopfia rhizophila CBS 207.26]
MIRGCRSIRRPISGTRRPAITIRRLFHPLDPPHYTYKPLRVGEIRLIDLQPGRDVDPIKCGIRGVVPERSTPYESISYCWGVNKADAKIECDGRVIPVTKNLCSALRHLRNEHTDRTIWIDAICINQGDVDERGYQVSLMKDIFQKSKRTVVWLGEESDETDAAIKLMKELASLFTDPRGHTGWTHEAGNIPPLYDPAWRAFANLLQRPWFQRAWIVQEVSVTRDIQVVCGKASISWNDFARAVQYAVDLGVFIAYGGSTTYQALRLLETRSKFQNGDLPTLHDVLLKNRSFLATDARDKVFGLLSLANPEDVRAMEVKPDYHLRVEELYKSITVNLLNKRGLAAFSASGIHSISGSTDLPSWVSDWSAFDPSLPLTSPDSLEYGDRSSYTMRSAPDYNASSSTTSLPIINHSQNLLGLHGLLIDQVETVGTLSRTRYLRHVSHMFELFVQCRDVLEQLKDWEYVARARSWDRYITGEKNLDVYWQTLCAGYVHENQVSARKDPRFKYYVMIRSLRSFVRFTIRWFPRTEEDTSYNRLFYSMFQAIWRIFGLTPAKIQRIGFPPQSRLSNYRRMVRTKKGYVALAPRFTRSGDWIGVFKGGKMPLIVRQEGEYWVLIGESYVHGIMKGEA